MMRFNFDGLELKLVEVRKYAHIISKEVVNRYLEWAES